MSDRNVTDEKGVPRESQVERPGRWVAVSEEEMEERKRRQFGEDVTAYVQAQRCGRGEHEPLVEEALVVAPVDFDAQAKLQINGDEEINLFVEVHIKLPDGTEIARPVEICRHCRCVYVERG